VCVYAQESDVYMYHTFASWEIIGWFVVYGIIAFLAVSGNLLVVYVVCTRPKLRNVPNYFIVNLAVSWRVGVRAHIMHAYNRWPMQSPV
jgi:hypothetical protein